MSLRSVIRLAHLSDTHLAGEPGTLTYGQDAAANLGAVVEAFPSRPDVAVITGDLAEDGNIEAYRTVRALTSDLADELHVVPGNHDDRANMAQVFDACAALRFVTLSPRWTMVLVNSKWAGHGAGRIDSETLAALDRALAQSAHHAVVCMHHPPASTCDNAYCVIVNAAETLRVLHRH